MLTIVVTNFLPSSYRRYIELNVKSSGGYRRYSEEVAHFLMDRPQKIVEHIDAKFKDAMSFYRHELITQLEEGVFWVWSQSNTSNQHLVQFGSSSTMPSCSGKDWQKNLLLCKHFCAVFLFIPGCGWEQLPVKYRDNPLYSLDPVCLNSSLPSPRDGASSLVEPSTPPRHGASSLVEPPRGGLPENIHKKHDKKRRECSTLLREIRDLMYQLSDIPFLDSVKARLTDLLDDVRHHTPHDKTLSLVSTPPPAKKAKYLPLKSHRKSHPFSGRHGKHAEVMRSCFKPQTGFQPQPQPQPGNQPGPRPQLATRPSASLTNTPSLC
ncbi:hypothetical protein GJAV_G00114240 [Gymnothorax javanicus]|nr:hypothetical protein GJAV_G00114240 [Gymnothorax javanicus]